MPRFSRTALAALIPSLISLTGCQHLVITTEKLFQPPDLTEIVGFVAGLGTTFAAFPDLMAMVRHRSSVCMNARMPATIGFFQALWIYYGFLIASRPLIIWSGIGALINLLTVAAYRHFLVLEGQKSDSGTSM
jgi:uncharacterized protein with PQ loop repeat